MAFRTRPSLSSDRSTRDAPSEGDVLEAVAIVHGEGLQYLQWANGKYSVLMDPNQTITPMFERVGDLTKMAPTGGKLVVNGNFDQKTIEALQTFLNNHWSEAGWRSQQLAVDGNPQNGFGPSSIKALQTFLNHQHTTATDVHRKVVYLSICLSRGSCSVVATD